MPLLLLAVVFSITCRSGGLPGMTRQAASSSEITRARVPPLVPRGVRLATGFLKAVRRRERGASWARRPSTPSYHRK